MPRVSVLGASHMFFGKLTLAVRSDAQGRGVGRALLEGLLERVDGLRPEVIRTELMLQDGNPAAFALYASFGFVEEGRLIDRVKTPDGSLRDDVLMARVRR